MNKKCLTRHFLTALMLCLTILLIIPYSIFANEPKDQDDSRTITLDGFVNLNVVVKTDNWIVLTCSDNINNKAAAAQVIDAYLAKTLAEMADTNNKLTANEEQTALLSGSNYMEDEDTTQFGNGNLYSFFDTYVSWSSSPASFWGSHGANWSGSSPSSTCDIGIEITLSPEEIAGVITAVPNGWINLYFTCTSGLIATFNNWYLIAPWNGLRANYPYETYMEQNDSTTFQFDGYSDQVHTLWWFVPYGE